MVSERERFETLRRDDFTCRTCGARMNVEELTAQEDVTTSLGVRKRHLYAQCDDCSTHRRKPCDPPGACLLSQR